MRSFQFLVVFYLFVVTFSQDDFDCQFCEIDDSNYDITNIGYSWKIPPSFWDDELPYLVYHAMAISYAEYETSTYGLVAHGGGNVSGSVSTTQGDSKTYVIKITLAPEKNYGNYNNTLEFREINNNLLQNPIMGHTFTTYPACYGCHPNSSLDGEQGIVMFGGFEGSNPTASQKTYIITLNMEDFNITVYTPTVGTTIPEARGYHSAVNTLYYGRVAGINGLVKYSTAGSVIIFGGQKSSEYDNKVWAFHLQTETWELLHDGSGTGNYPAARAYHKAVEYNYKMYIFGGKNSTTILGEMWAFDFASKTWSEITQNSDFVPSERFFHSLEVTSGGKILLFSGINMTSSKTIIQSDLWEFDIEKNYWNVNCINRDTESLKYRFAHSSLMLEGDGMFIYGGISVDSTIGKGVFIGHPRIYDFYEKRDIDYCFDNCNYLTTCVEYDLEQLPSCSEPTPYPCRNYTGIGNTFNDTCVSFPTECTTFCSEPYYACWDGVCVSYSDQCKPFPECADGETRCFDGTCSEFCDAEKPECGIFCVPTTECLESCCNLTCSAQNCSGSPCIPAEEGDEVWMDACCIEDPTPCCAYNTTCNCTEIHECGDSGGVARDLCVDGCQENYYFGCLPYYGCNGGEMRCPDGNCVSNWTECSWTCDDYEYYCYDGTCSATREGCPTPPFTKKLESKTTEITTDSTGRKITLSATDGSVIGYFYVGCQSSCNIYFSTVATIADSILRYNITPYDGWTEFYYGVGARSDYFANIFSTIVTLQVETRDDLGRLEDDISFSDGYFKLMLKTATWVATNYAETCLGYITSEQKWACISPGTSYLTTSGFPGKLITSDDYWGQSEGLSYRGTFAFIRQKWLDPDLTQVMVDLAKFTEDTIVEVIGDFDVLEFEVDVENYTITLVVLVSDLTGLENSIKTNFKTRYNWDTGKIKISATKQSTKRQSYYELTIQLSNSVFPPEPEPETPVTPVVVPVPQPSTPTPTPVQSVPMVTPSSGWQDNQDLFIGIIIGGLVVIVAVSGIFYLCCKSSGPKQGRKDKINDNYSREAGRGGTNTRTGGPTQRTAAQYRSQQQTQEQQSVNLDETDKTGPPPPPPLSGAMRNGLVLDDDFGAENGDAIDGVTAPSLDDSKFVLNSSIDDTAADSGKFVLTPPMIAGEPGTGFLLTEDMLNDSGSTGFVLQPSSSNLVDD